MNRFKKWSIPVMLCTFLLITPQQTWANQEMHYSQEAPENISSIAVQVTKLVYPELDVVDLEYVGREEKEGDMAEELFKFQVENEEDFLVNVRILYNTNTERITSITFEENR